MTSRRHRMRRRPRLAISGCWAITACSVATAGTLITSTVFSTANDFVSDAQFDKLLDAWFGNIARVLEEGRGFYIWGGYANCGNYPPFLKKHGLYFSQAIIWNKQHPVLTRKDFMGAHEWSFYGWREGAAHKFYGPNNATDLWSVKKVNPQ